MANECREVFPEGQRQGLYLTDIVQDFPVGQIFSYGTPHRYFAMVFASYPAGKGVVRLLDGQAWLLNTNGATEFLNVVRIPVKTKLEITQGGGRE